MDAQSYDNSWNEILFQDGYILAALLSNPLTTLETIPVALEIYDTIRQPLGNDVQARSAQQGRYYEFNAERFNDLAGESSPTEMAEMAKAVDENNSWVWNRVASLDRKKALDLLETRLGGKYL